MDKIEKEFDIPKKVGDKEHLLNYVKNKLEAYIKAVKASDPSKRSAVSYKAYLDINNEKSLMRNYLHWSATDKLGHAPRKNKIRTIIDG